MSFSSIVLNLQRLLLGIFGLSLLILLGLLFLTDPYQNNVYFIAFIANLFVFLSSSFCLFGFWVTFYKKYVDLTNLRVTTIIKQSILASAYICMILFLSVISQLNFFSFGLMTLGYILFEIAMS